MSTLKQRMSAAYDKLQKEKKENLKKTAEDIIRDLRNDGRGKKINWGNINENIMALCIGCRFLFKNRDIRESDYYKILEFHFKDKKNIVNLKSANKKTTIKDDLEITLSDLYRKELYTERNTEKYKKILKSNIDYVNDSKIKSWSVYLYNNGVKDYIKVRSVGKLGKKSDINVFIKNKKGDFKDINLDISAKLDINQFGQYAGTDYEKLNNFLKDIFGNGTKEIEGKYNRIITGENNPQKSQKDRSKQSLSLIYGHIFGKAKKNIKIQTLFDGIIKYMSGGQQNFQIIETKFEGVNIFDVKKINDILSELNEMELKAFDEKIKLEYSTYGTEKLPKIQVYFEDKILITVRVKYETSGDKFRNYIEKGPKLEELIKIQKEEDTLNVSTRSWKKSKGSSYKIVRT